MSDKDMAEFSSASIRRLWEHTKGRAWEPRGGTDSPAVRRLIAAGYVEKCDMRCMFEAFKDSGLRWTEAGKRAAQIASQTPSALTEGKQ